jgi:hypothetical protein
MDGNIIEEDDRGIGVRVIDNNQINHTVAVGFDGKIQGHSQDGYHNKAAKRTHDDNERVEQARRFARYYVFQERGYDTLPPQENPVRIEASRRALKRLSTPTFESMFGDLYQQFTSDFDPTVEGVVDLPSDVADEDLVVYQRDLYLGFEPDNIEFGDEVRRLAEEYSVDLTAPATESSAEAWRQFGQTAAEVAVDSDDSLLSGMELSAVSGIHLVYPDSSKNEQRVTAETPLAREPDARIELPSVDPGSIERFQAFLAFHLRCQIRDLFIGMGVEPPEAFRVRGPGRYSSTMRYRLLDMYDEYYHLDDPALDGWAEA